VKSKNRSVGSSPAIRLGLMERSFPIRKSEVDGLRIMLRSGENKFPKHEKDVLGGKEKGRKVGQ